jgi:hypothetical protein
MTHMKHVNMLCDKTWKLLILKQMVLKINNELYRVDIIIL